MRLKRKLSQDKNGISGGLLILIIIVVGLIGWEVAGGYLGIITPSQWFNDAVNEDEPAVISMSFELYDTQANDFVEKGIVPDDVNFPNMVDNITAIDIDSNAVIEFHEIVITTNAPKILFGSAYHIRITGEEHVVGTNDFWNYFDFDVRAGEGDKTIRYRLEGDKVSVATILFDEWTEFLIQLTDPDGNIVTTEIFYLY